MNRMLLVFEVVFFVFTLQLSAQKVGDFQDFNSNDYSTNSFKQMGQHSNHWDLPALNPAFLFPDHDKLHLSISHNFMIPVTYTLGTTSSTVDGLPIEAEFKDIFTKPHTWMPTSFNFSFLLKTYAFSIFYFQPAAYEREAQINLTYLDTNNATEYPELTNLHRRNVHYISQFGFTVAKSWQINDVKFSVGVRPFAGMLHNRMSEEFSFGNSTPELEFGAHFGINLVFSENTHFGVWYEPEKKYEYYYEQSANNALPRAGTAEQKVYYDKRTPEKISINLSTHLTKNLTCATTLSRWNWPTYSDINSTFTASFLASYQHSAQNLHFWGGAIISENRWGGSPSNYFPKNDIYLLAGASYLLRKFTLSLEISDRRIDAADRTRTTFFKTGFGYNL